MPRSVSPRRISRPRTKADPTQRQRSRTPAKRLSKPRRSPSTSTRRRKQPNPKRNVSTSPNRSLVNSAEGKSVEKTKLETTSKRKMAARKARESDADLEMASLPAESQPKSSTFLSASDRSGIITLLVLYWVQGVPIGLVFGSIPLLIQQSATLTEQATFALAAWPYSLKLFWSPIVDSFFSDKIGRRKTWIIPTQALSAVVLFYLSYSIEDMVAHSKDRVYDLTACFFLLIFLAATQDIAVDGWALTMLSKENVSMASTCQNVGQTAGFLMSYTIFLALNEPTFVNTYLRAEPSERGLVSLGEYTMFCAIVYVTVTVVIALFKYEGPFIPSDPSEKEELLWKLVYRKIFGVLQLRNVILLCLLLVTCKVGFAANDAALVFKFLDKGFPKASMAVLALVQFPLDIVFSYIGGKLAGGDKPLRVWVYAYVLRLVMCVVCTGVLFYFPEGGEITTGWYAIVILSTALTSLGSTLMFVTICGFFMKIGDPEIGGTYLTVLTTITNLGGTWPKSPVLYLMDQFTISKCVAATGGILQEYTCSTADERQMCTDGGGQCVTEQDGYYIVSMACILLGIATCLFWMPIVERLQSAKEETWRVSKIAKDASVGDEYGAHHNREIKIG